jgi:L-amino acid ligase C-terminal domain 2
VTGSPRRSTQIPIVHIRRAVGDTVNEARRNGDRLGYFVVVGPEAGAAARHADELLEGLRIEVSTNLGSP